MSPSEERLLLSYCGARRFAYNWVLATVKENLATRRVEREIGVSEDELTPALSWKATRLGTLWNERKDEVAPWWREVSMHAFRSGIADAARALENWSTSRSGQRKGRRVGFPRFKKRDKTVPSVSFVEINHQLSWLHECRHAIRLMLPQSTTDQVVKRRRAELAWLHTTTSTRRMYRLVEQGGASIQEVWIARRGGRWQASLVVRYRLDARPTPKPRKRHGEVVGVDGGVKHLATLSRPVPGLTDEHGHIANPKVLDSQLRRLLTYKTTDCGSHLVVADRIYPSSTTCCACGLVKAKLALRERVFICDDPACATTLDRDVNAARNIAREATRLLEHQNTVAGLRPETRNAEPRPRQSSPACAGMAAVA